MLNLVVLCFDQLFPLISEMEVICKYNHQSSPNPTNPDTWYNFRIKYKSLCKRCTLEYVLNFWFIFRLHVCKTLNFYICWNKCSPGRSHVLTNHSFRGMYIRDWSAGGRNCLEKCWESKGWLFPLTWKKSPQLSGERKKTRKWRHRRRTQINEPRDIKCDQIH